AQELGAHLVRIGAIDCPFRAWKFRLVLAEQVQLARHAGSPSGGDPADGTVPEDAGSCDGSPSVVPGSLAAARATSGPATIRSSKSACCGSSAISRPSTLRRFNRSSVYSASQPSGWIFSSGEGGRLSPISGFVRSRRR